MKLGNVISGHFPPSFVELQQINGTIEIISNELCWKKGFFCLFSKANCQNHEAIRLIEPAKLTVAPDCNAFLKPWQPIKLFNKRELLKKELCWKEAYLLILVQWPRKKMRFITESVKWSRVVKSSDVDICNQRPNNLKCWNSEKWTLLKIRSFIYRL